jgi:hypothetical protein
VVGNINFLCVEIEITKQGVFGAKCRSVLYHVELCILYLNVTDTISTDG